VRPPEFEQGWKDTVRCNPNESTLLLMRFDGFAGVYVYHCHILEHEDMGMMFRVRVEP
jgi:FtsP/CotA-like multicopper oxidase with cupredoxin domain